MYFDGAVVLLHDAQHRRQAEAGARAHRFRGEERLEQTVCVSSVIPGLTVPASRPRLQQTSHRVTVSVEHVRSHAGRPQRVRHLIRPRVQRR